MKLANRVAVITGAGNGIGQAIARTFASEGANIVCADIDIAAAAATVADLSTESIASETDVGEYQSCVTMIERAVERFGRVDIMVNNAAIAPTRKFLELEPEIFERVMAINVSAALYCGQAASRDMLDRKWGRIINIASISGQRAGFGRTAYGTSKGAVIQLTKQMALELGPFGITANAIAPGPVETKTALAGHTPGTREGYLRMIPVGRYGEVSEMAAAALFLASEDAAYINGHVLNVDGGFMATGITYDDY